jgi:hypothetical protein
VDCAVGAAIATTTTLLSATAATTARLADGARDHHGMSGTTPGSFSLPGHSLCRAAASPHWGTAAVARYGSRQLALIP